MADSDWTCRLVRFGLVRPSFVPPKPIRELRNLTRYRRTRVEERTRETQRLDKVLQDAGIKLSSVASDVLGKSGRDMLDALVAGSHDPEILAELARGRLRAKLPQLQSALKGRFGPNHALVVGEILAHIDYLDESIARLQVGIDELIALSLTSGTGSVRSRGSTRSWPRRSSVRSVSTWGRSRALGAGTPSARDRLASPSRRWPPEPRRGRRASGCRSRHLRR